MPIALHPRRQGPIGYGAARDLLAQLAAVCQGQAKAGQGPSAKVGLMGSRGVGWARAGAQLLQTPLSGLRGGKRGALCMRVRGASGASLRLVGLPSFARAPCTPHLTPLSFTSTPPRYPRTPSFTPPDQLPHHSLPPHSQPIKALFFTELIPDLWPPISAEITKATGFKIAQPDGVVGGVAWALAAWAPGFWPAPAC